MTDASSIKEPVTSGQNDLGIAPDLLAMLVCPVDHAELKTEAGALVCTQCGRRYPVSDGIPNMVVE
ncbi:MAG: Trm112 family protein [Thermomicrobiales bacterium]